jgi:hypothetical protein
MENCRLADRVDLLFRWIAGSGCPDVVTLQEVWTDSVPLIMSHLASTCPFVYQGVQGQSEAGPDDEMVLTRYPVLATEHLPLFPAPALRCGSASITRSVRWMFTTHLARPTAGRRRARLRGCLPNVSLRARRRGATVRRCRWWRSSTPSTTSTRRR